MSYKITEYPTNWQMVTLGFPFIALNLPTSAECHRTYSYHSGPALSCDKTNLVGKVDGHKIPRRYSYTGSTSKN